MYTYVCFFFLKHYTSLSMSVYQYICKYISRIYIVYVCIQKQEDASSH